MVLGQCVVSPARGASTRTHANSDNIWFFVILNWPLELPVLEMPSCIFGTCDSEGNTSKIHWRCCMRMMMHKDEVETWKQGGIGRCMGKSSSSRVVINLKNVANEPDSLSFLVMKKSCNTNIFMLICEHNCIKPLVLACHPSEKSDVNLFCLMSTYFYLKLKISRIK